MKYLETVKEFFGIGYRRIGLVMTKGTYEAILRLRRLPEQTAVDVISTALYELEGRRGGSDPKRPRPKFRIIDGGRH